VGSIQKRDNEFLDQAGENSPGLIAEFWDFLRHNRRWWLAPIIIALLLLSIFVVLTGTVAGPFIYTFF
jgi:hypothetical protein